MAKSTAEKEEKAAKKSASDLAETYNEHNHETAQAGHVSKQCQCADCEEYRAIL